MREARIYRTGLSRSATRRLISRVCDDVSGGSPIRSPTAPALLEESDLRDRLAITVDHRTPFEKSYSFLMFPPRYRPPNAPAKLRRASATSKYAWASRAPPASAGC